MRQKINWKYLLISFVFVFLTAFIGSQFTDIGPWYDSIKPAITPPNYVFPIVWTSLFFLIALSFYLALSYSSEKQKKIVYLVYISNFILNVFWSILYFSLKNPFFSFLEIIVLFFSILIIILTVYKINKISSYLLIPYLLWVSFASILNYLSI
jgi:translocator protein